MTLSLSRRIVYVLAALLLLFLWGCTGRSIEKTESPVSVEKPDAPSKELVVETTESPTVPQAEKELSTEGNEKEARSTPVAEAHGSLPVDEKKEAESITTVIERLEECYKTNDFEKWLSMLTPRYKQRYNDTKFLSEEGWDVNNIKEFFYLLVNARKKRNIRDLQISRVEFINPNKAYIYVYLGDREFPEPQHTFIKLGNSWYKGLSKEGE